MSSPNPNILTNEKQQFLTEAVQFLEFPGLLMKLTDMIGRPIELAHDALPVKTRDAIQVATQEALLKALALAISTTPKETVTKTDWGELQSKISQKSWAHMATTGATGAIGGFFGLAGLVVELPISTTIMLRSISEVANTYGEDLNAIENRLECLYIFTLGSKDKTHDDAMESSYLTSRVAFSQAIKAAAEFISIYGAREVLKAVEKGTAPGVLQFISRVAAYFEVNVTEKVLAEAVPVVGAVGGAAINTVFTKHFTDAAKYHYGLKKIEQEMGSENFQAAYSNALATLKFKQSA